MRLCELFDAEIQSYYRSILCPPHFKILKAYTPYADLTDNAAASKQTQ